MPKKNNNLLSPWPVESWPDEGEDECELDDDDDDDEALLAYFKKFGFWWCGSINFAESANFLPIKYYKFTFCKWVLII